MRSLADNELESGEAAARWLPVEMARARLSFLQHIKGFVLMLVFVSHYVVFQTIRIDALFGMQTMGWYEKALSTVGLDSFGSLTNLSSAVDFLEGHADAIRELHRTCPLCDVAVLSTGLDMRGLGIETSQEFLCSDFAKYVDLDDYDSRNCTAANAAWQGSLGNTTWWDASVNLPVPCCRQTEGGEEAQTVVSRSVELTAKATLQREGSMELQVVISRGQRMVGILYSAELTDAVYAPELLSARMKHWTYNYSDEENDYDTPKMIGLILLISIFVNEVFECLSYSVRGRAKYLLHPYFLAIELPSFVFPITIEVIKNSIPTRTWAFWVTFNVRRPSFPRRSPRSPLFLTASPTRRNICCTLASSRRVRCCRRCA